MENDTKFCSPKPGESFKAFKARFRREVNRRLNAGAPPKPKRTPKPKPRTAPELIRELRAAVNGGAFLASRCHRDSG